MGAANHRTLLQTSAGDGKLGVVGYFDAGNVLSVDSIVRLLVLLLAASAAAHAAAPDCVGSVSVANFEISVRQSAGGPALPLRKVNLLASGYEVIYRPLHPEKLDDDAEVAIVAVSSGSNSELTVLEPKDGRKEASWKLPARTSVLSVVFGPKGLDYKKIKSLVKKDQQMISQLADYAEKTAQTEILIEALLAGGGSQNFDAALQGISAQSGASLAKLDKKQPADQQLALLMRTLNPALSGYDPLAPEPRRMQQSVGVAAAVAGLFFGNSVGLAAGGVAMLDNFRTLLFPNTEFRSAFAQSASANGLALCAKREASKARTRWAYLWAVRVPDSEAPAIKLADDIHLPLGVKAAVPAEASDWRFLARIREWRLQKGDQQIPISVQPDPEKKMLQVDLTALPADAGDYKLSGKWDWQTVEAAGTLHLHQIPDLRKAVLAPASEDRLVEGLGPAGVVLSGPDFRFVEKVAFRPVENRDAPPVEVPFDLAGGQLKTSINTATLKRGLYLLAITQAGGTTQEIPFQVLPPHPVIEGLPLRANLGEQAQPLRLRGSGLDRIEKIESQSADIDFKSPGQLLVTLHEDVKKGDRIDLMASVKNVHEPIVFPGALQVAGPRPRIGATRASLPEGIGIALLRSELPAGLFTSFSVEVQHADEQPSFRLGCRESTRSLAAIDLKPGEQTSSARLRAAGLGNLFLSFDPGSVGQPGCTVVATVETASAGVSDPHELGRVVRLPVIDSFELTDEKLREGVFAGWIKGQDLETIEKTGWDPHNGVPVEQLPSAVQGQKQVLKIAMPWPAPAPKSPLYVWLRGETEGRLTAAKY